MCPQVRRVAWDSWGIALSRRLDRARFLASKYEDYDGEARAVFVEFGVKDAGRAAWLLAWARLDTACEDSVLFPAFCKHTGLPQDVWSKRLFALFAPEHERGVLRLRSFLRQIWTLCLFSRRTRRLQYPLFTVPLLLCVCWGIMSRIYHSRFRSVDREACEVLAFRLVSRCGDQFDERYSCLDELDVRHFVLERYALGPRSARKKSTRVCRFVDRDCSGGINFAEFQAFSADNAQRSPSLLLFSSPYASREF